MEAHYRAFQGRLVIKVEGESIQDLFEKIGPVAEALDGDQCCGKCQSPQIYPRARKAQEFTYYEIVCSECGAKLSFGQHKKGGTMWPKREDDNGNKLDNRGWRIYLSLPAPEEHPVQSAPTTAKPPARLAPDPRLEGYLRRCTDVGTSGEVFGEICDGIGALSSDEQVNEVWNHALKTHGDPNNKPAALRPVLISLLNALSALESKVKQ